MDENDQVIKLPSKGQILINTNNGLKHFDQREPHQICILSCVLDHVTVIQQNIEQTTRFI